jgi:bifunctional non-homologous end joining protein LigD
MAAERTPLKVGTRTLSVSNLDKVLFPRDGYTKGDLIAYYRSVAAAILPHVRDRPLTLQRYPDGIAGESFFEKHLPKGVPDWMPRIAVTSPEARRAKTTYLMCNDEAALAYVANLAAIVLHVWTSRAETVESPDYVFFDLDPGEQCSMKTLAGAALAIRALLDGIGLQTLVKTSGGMGLHVVVPLATGYTYEAAKLFAELVAHRLAASDAAQVTLERSLARRDQRLVYFDYLQVGRGKTIVAPYSVRARDGAPVSTPLQWSEVEAFARKRTGAPWDHFAAFTMKTAAERIEKLGDLWGGSAWKKQRLEGAVSKAQRSWRE